MKRNLPAKSLFLSVVIFSLSAFVFVNLHASLTVPQQGCEQQVQLEHPQVKEESDDAEPREIPVPDVTVIGRLVELAQKFLPVAN